MIGSYVFAGCYVIAMFLLALHLSHGSSSFFQSLGFNDKKMAPRLAWGGRIFAWLIFIGYTSMPVAVLLGLIWSSRRAKDNVVSPDEVLLPDSPTRPPIASVEFTT